jgi:hypothetical protein
MHKWTWTDLEREEVDERRKEDTGGGLINIEMNIGVQDTKTMNPGR